MIYLMKRDPAMYKHAVNLRAISRTNSERNPKKVAFKYFDKNFECLSEWEKDELSSLAYNINWMASQLRERFEKERAIEKGKSEFIIERYSENASYWSPIVKIPLNETSKEEYGYWEDFTIESNVHYKYRLVDRTNNNNYAYYLYSGRDSQGELVDNVAVQFEDIFISDEDAMFVVRYNPNISSFKYVVQDSITNTLGGKYPIIRSNGDTKYRQFNISGLIYADGLVSSDVSTDSYINNRNLDDNVIAWYENRENILYLPTGQTLTSRPVKLEVAEKIAKQKIIDFLTNKKPKLFRSFEEGNMIVYLNNISFTPNKTLGRHVYDFSATATEVCECNTKNLQKYRLNNNNYSPATTILLQG